MCQIDNATLRFLNGQIICLLSWSTHSFWATQKVHLWIVQIVSKPCSKKRICCSFGGVVKSVLVDKKGNTGDAKRGGCCYLYMADPPPSHSLLTCVVPKLQTTLTSACSFVIINEWYKRMVKPWNKRMSSLLDMGRGEAQKAGTVCQRVREECALKTNRLFAAFWPEQWLNGRYGGAAGVSAQPFSGRSVFVARLKEFVRLKGSWTGPGASMSYTLGVCEA